jgi:hypothetical protein
MYTGGALAPEIVRELEGLCGSCAHLPGGDVRVVPVAGGEAGRRIFRWLPGGIADFIHHASLTFVILSTGLPSDPEDAGFCGEQVVLHACSLGVGTCWASASFSRKAALSLAGARHDEDVICVISAGAPDPHARTRHKHRKPFRQICSASPDALPKWICEGIRCVTVAPSGSNLQPWWFEVRDVASGAPEVVLWHRKPGSAIWPPAIGPRRIDHGIAMLHFWVGAASAGAEGRWSLRPGGGAVARFRLGG